MRYRALLLFLLLPVLAGAQEGAAPATGKCGQLVSLPTHGSSTTRYSLNPPAKADDAIVLVLLPGGGGHVDLDADACPRALVGNALVRMRAAFAALGLTTVLVDAPSDYPGDDGLAGFRSAPEHADDIGKLIMDLRTRTGGAVWLVGNSRGTISAVNAAARLSGPAAPNGVVLTSALMVGQTGAKKSYVAQTVFDHPLEAIRQPLLVIGHAEDKCLRSPASQFPRILERSKSARSQGVTVNGGPGWPGAASLAACEGRAPHGFVDQEAEVAAGIARFVRGQAY